MANAFYTLFAVCCLFVISPLFRCCSRIVYSRLYSYSLPGHTSLRQRNVTCLNPPERFYSQSFSFHLWFKSTEESRYYTPCDFNSSKFRIASLKEMFWICLKDIFLSISIHPLFIINCIKMYNLHHLYKR